MAGSLDDLNLEDTSSELADVFRHMTPLLHKSRMKTFAPKNGDIPGPKRKKTHGKSQGKGKGQDQDMTSGGLIPLMAKVLLRHDQQLRSMLVDNSFVAFLGQNPQGMLPVMIAETQQWKQDLEAKKVTRSLRSQLWLVVCQTLHKRVLQISQADSKGELIQQCQKAKILLPDLRWNHHQKEYTVSETEPMSSQKLLTICQALIDHAMEPDLVQTFHTLKGQATSSQETDRAHSLDDPVLHALPGHMVCTAPDSAPFCVATSSHEMEAVQPETQHANPTAAEDLALHALGTLTQMSILLCWHLCALTMTPTGATPMLR